MRATLAAAVIMLVALGPAGPASAHSPSNKDKSAAPEAQYQQTFDSAQLIYTYIEGTFSPEFEPPTPGTYTLPAIDTVSNHPVLDSSGRRIGLFDLKEGKLAVIAFIYSLAAAVPLDLRDALAGVGLSGAHGPVRAA